MLTTVTHKQVPVISSGPSILHLPSSSREELQVTPSIWMPSTSVGGIDASHKPYRCAHNGCTKAYSKPSRLAEHERCHTGDRPYQCPTCDKRYLRETHLQAHSRSHLPNAERPFVCTEDNCAKRFWTAQHLRAHSELHKGAKPYKCSEPSCGADFSKHHQLREHIRTTHAPPGTKPYQCEHDGCSKSFSTSQKLRAHHKTHDDQRYTCVYPSCMPTGEALPVYFPTWTLLQHHIRSLHPPACPYPLCEGRKFASQRGLRAHLKIHEMRNLESAMNLSAAVSADVDEAERDEAEPPAKRRRGGEIGRDFVCEVERCGKDFKSKKALMNHHNINHLGYRDFTCAHERCSRRFGYRHLLQRHVARVHVSNSSVHSIRESLGGNVGQGNPLSSSSIDDITGVTYSIQNKAQAERAVKLTCPHPDLPFLPQAQSRGTGGHQRCQYAFSRAYDLHRHFKAEHGLEVEKGQISEWVQQRKRAETMPC